MGDGLPVGTDRRISTAVRPSRPAVVTAALWAALVLAVAPTRAQEATALLRGAVTDTFGTRVPHALVRLLPAGAERFTDVLGGFVFAGLEPGSYRLQARQVGFEPHESTVTLGSGEATVRVTLRPLIIRLDELTVSVAGRCRAPGSPESGPEAALAAVFSQLRENARRFAVLADSYPFQYFVERIFTNTLEEGSDRTIATDTVAFESSARPRYRPGRVVGWGVGPRGTRTRAIQLPSLPDLADSAFIANHCFGFGGTVERDDGRRLLRVTFRASEDLRSSDVDGHADLDPDTYQLRTLSTRLTRPGRAMTGVASASATIELTELFPGLLVPGSVRSVVEPTIDARGLPPVRSFVDVQRLLRARFIRASPADTTVVP